jgi:hypothetical protein
VSGNGPSIKNYQKNKIKINQDLKLRSPFASFVGAFIAQLEKGISPKEIREKLRKKSEVIKCFGFTDEIGIKCQLGAPEKKCCFEQFVTPWEISGNFKASVDCACDRHRVCGTKPNEGNGNEGVADTGANVKDNESDASSVGAQNCAACGVSSANFTCGNCRCVFYCGKSCQIKHWTQGHKSVCVLIIANDEAKEAQESTAAASFRTIKDDLETDNKGADDTDPLYIAAIRAARAPKKTQVPWIPFSPRGNSRMTSAAAGGGDAVVSFSGAAIRSGRKGSSSIDDYTAILDSGANRHLLNGRLKLRNLRPASINMTTADGSKTHISEMGDLILRSEDEYGNEMDPLILSDASVHRGSPLNLVSVGVLCEQGVSFHFAKGNSYFEHRGRKFKLVERDGLYLMRLDEILRPEDVHALRVSSDRPEEVYGESKSGNTSFGCAATFDLWHERFGFTSKKRLKFLYDNGSVEGLAVQGKYTHDARCKCTVCMSMNNAKLHIGDTRKYADPVTRKGELLYSDLLGPYPESVEGYQYVISFTDVYSRFSHCYMLRYKSEAEEALEALIRYYKKEGILIKKIRTDQGGEFGGHNEGPSDAGGTAPLPTEDGPAPHVFKLVCAENGITHELMPAKRPELHGLAERWNLTVPKMANAMLFAARLSHLLWPAAIAHANMLRNRLPLRGLGSFTPYELFFNRRPRIDNLRVFGCDCYKLLPTFPKIPGQMARKRLIYCGESADRVGFRCFDPLTFKYSTEFELIFDEGSAKKRINALREYDMRRELQRQGRLHELPLIADDFADEAAHNVERTVFSSGSDHPLTFGDSEDGGGLSELSGTHTPTEEAHSSDGGNGSSASELRERSGASSSKTFEDNVERDLFPALDGRGQKPRISNAAERSGTNQVNDTSLNRHNTLSAEEFENAPSGAKTNAASSHMGDEAASLQHSNHGSKRGSAAPSHTSLEGSIEDDIEDSEVRGPRLRPGRAPTMQSRSLEEDASPSTRRSTRIAQTKLKDVDAAISSLQDREAELYGPLTKKALDAERARSRLDPRHPRRPLRHAPIGQYVADTEEFKNFRRVAFENDFLIKLVENPKKPASKSWHRYQKYCLASTLREIVELSVDAKDPAERKKQRELAM